MNNISIRGYIKKNFKNSDEKEIRNSIETSLKENTEETLPGLGVLFEVLWQNSNQTQRDEIITNLKNGLSWQTAGFLYCPIYIYSPAK